MKLTIVVVCALVSLSSAHNDPRDALAGTPQFLGGRRLLSALKARNILPDGFTASRAHIEERQPVTHEALDNLDIRQSTNSRCGAGFGTSCGATECCSPEGYCGVGIDYCAAPDCQFMYGPKCDANQVPAGSSTASIARPVLGNVPYGGDGIYDCAVAGDVAFTFDDGPYSYTSDLLDKLKVYNAKATFFITGNNLGKGPIDTTSAWSTVIKRMIAEGHQVASHTWSHQNLTTLDATHFNNQMVYNEMAFRNILGYFPTYMRPPYSSCDAACAAKLKTLGYHVTYFDLDTAGYLNDSPTLIKNSKKIWDAAIKGANSATSSFLEIEHDIHYQTVYNLTDYILASMYKNGFKSVTVGDCLGDPAANWYRSAGSSAPTGPATISVDGSCSGTVTCQGSSFGNCCSQYGYCGSTSNYCGTGCQPGSGTCGISSSSSSASAKFSSSSISFNSASSASSVGIITSVSSALVSSTTMPPNTITTSSTSSTSNFGSSSQASSNLVVPSSSKTFGSSSIAFVSSSSIFSTSGILRSSVTFASVSSSPIISTTKSVSYSSNIYSSPVSAYSSLRLQVTSYSLSSTAQSSILSSSLQSSRSFSSLQSSVSSASSHSIISSTISSLVVLASTTSSSNSEFSTSSKSSSSTSKSSSSSVQTSTSSSRSSSTVLPSTSTKVPSTSSLKPSSTSSSKTSTTSSASQAISTDGSCSTTITCQGSVFGNCCSQYGWCGSTTAYCGTGCKPGSGSCSASGSVAKVLSTTSSFSISLSTSISSLTSKSPSRSTLPSAPPPITASPDGTCGGINRNTCVGE